MSNNNNSKASNQLKASWLLDSLNKYPDQLPTVRSVIHCFLTYSMNGEALNDRKTKREIKKISKESIKRIKKNRIITNDDNPLFKLIKDCENKAIEGANLSDEEFIFITELSGLYFMIIKDAFNTTSKCSSILEDLYKYRSRILSSGKEMDENIIRMFDFVEVAFITERVRGRTKRYDKEYTGNYYSSPDEDVNKVLMMQDLKPYIYPEQYTRAVETCNYKFSSYTVPKYIQAFLMLEYNASFAAVAHYLTQYSRNEEIEDIISELANYSRKGVQFYKFYRRSEGQELTEDNIAFLNLSREEMKKYETIHAREGSLQKKTLLPSWLRKKQNPQ